MSQLGAAWFLCTNIGDTTHGGFNWCMALPLAGLAKMSRR
ncbi:hypothetical protein I546_1823 [Mycobacterium kansasii 732]|nr:hypothetical protein I546_1823 [Mycobacterium kansasii 732]